MLRIAAAGFHCQRLRVVTVPSDKHNAVLALSPPRVLNLVGGMDSDIVALRYCELL